MVRKTLRGSGVLSLLPQRYVTTLIISLKSPLSPIAFGANAIAEDEAARVLLVRHRYMPGWQFPGGGVGRGELPEVAILRELKEEVGLVSSTLPQFVGLFTRKAGFVTNVIALYRLKNVVIDFKPNFEIAEVMFCDPASPPRDATPGTLRRLAEMRGETPQSPYW